MSKKNADQLAELLQRLEREETTLEEFLLAHPETPEELPGLIGTVETLKKLDIPGPDAAFRRNARLRLMNLSAARPQPVVPQVVPSPGTPLIFFLRRVLIGLTMIVALIVGGGLMTLPMQNALPGDVFYPGKLAMENLQLVSASPDEDAILSLRFASTRLTEIQLLIVQGRFEDVDIAVNSFEDNIDRAVLALAAVAKEDGRTTYPIMVRIESEMRSYSTTLTELLAFVPDQTQQVLARAIDASKIWGADSN